MGAILCQKTHQSFSDFKRNSTLLFYESLRWFCSVLFFFLFFFQVSGFPFYFYFSSMKSVFFLVHLRSRDRKLKGKTFREHSMFFILLFLIKSKFNCFKS